METRQSEKQFQMWNRFMYMLLGSSITLVFISSGLILYDAHWPGFGNYVGGIWGTIQFLTAALGCYLLWGRRWRAIPLADRINTIFGYFIASWLTLLALGLITDNAPVIEYYFLLVGSALLIASGYIWLLKRTSAPREEMFP